MTKGSFIADPKKFFDSLGGAHDAQIMGFMWNKKAKELSIELDDLNSNFLGLPEYKGERPININFTGVLSLDMDAQILGDQLNVYDITVDIEKSRYHFEIRCSPGGFFKGQCEQIAILDC